jgi:hypothetical protein
MRIRKSEEETRIARHNATARYREQHKEKLRLKRLEQKDILRAKAIVNNRSPKGIARRIRNLDTPIKRVTKILNDAKLRANVEGMIFDISVFELLKALPVSCDCCHKQLDYRCYYNQNKGKNPSAPSLDRRDSAIGYTRANTRIICWRCNNLRSNGTLLEFKTLAYYMTASNELPIIIRQANLTKGTALITTPASKIHYLVYGAAYRAKRDGINFEQLLHSLAAAPPNNCSCCNRVINYAIKGRPAYESPAIDRLDPTVGYSLMNSRVICCRCNFLKKDASLTEINFIIADLECLQPKTINEISPTYTV